jgi:hypothetical protein
MIQYRPGPPYVGAELFTTEMPYGNYLSLRLCLLADLTPSAHFPFDLRPSLSPLPQLLSLCPQAIK